MHPVEARGSRWSMAPPGDEVGRGRQRSSAPRPQIITSNVRFVRRFTRTEAAWCPGPDSNRHAPFGAADFKSAASAIPPPGLSLLPRYHSDPPARFSGIHRRHPAPRAQADFPSVPLSGTIDEAPRAGYFDCTTFAAPRRSALINAPRESIQPGAARGSDRVASVDQRVVADEEGRESWEPATTAVVSIR